MEDWFSGLEGILATVIRDFYNEDLTSFSNLQETGKFLMDIFSFKHRIRSFVEHLTNFYYRIPKQKKYAPQKSVQLITLENIINAIRNDVKAYWGCDIEVFKSKDASFITSDSPFLDNIMEGMSLLVLTNNLLLSIKKNNLTVTRFKFTHCTAGFVHITNKLIAETAQYWIVGESQEYLELYSESANEQHEVTITYEPVDHLTERFYFNS